MQRDTRVAQRTPKEREARQQYRQRHPDATAERERRKRERRKGRAEMRAAQLQRAGIDSYVGPGGMLIETEGATIDPAETLLAELERRGKRGGELRAVTQKEVRALGRSAPVALKINAPLSKSTKEQGNNTTGVVEAATAANSLDEEETV